MIITNMERKDSSEKQKGKFATRIDYAGELEGAQYPFEVKIRLGVYMISHPNPEDGSFVIRITSKNLHDWQPFATFVHD